MNIEHIHTGSRVPVALFLLLFPLIVSAQSLDKLRGSDKPTDKSLLQEYMQSKDATSRLTTPPMEGAIAPDQYIVGPSDMFTIGIWGPVNFSLPIAVTPEGSLIIPTVGELPAAGKTLSALKKEADRMIRKRYTLGEINFTLTIPRSFIVNLQGAVLKPGKVIASAVERADRVILDGITIELPKTSLSFPVKQEGEPFTDRAFALPKVNFTNQLYEHASTRNIQLIRRNGDHHRIDLDLYNATGDSRYNPFLLDGDRIFVPRKEEGNFLSILGAVNSPGRYEFVEGDRLSDLIRIAYGLNAQAQSDAVRLSRLDENGNESETRVFQWSGATVLSEDPLLQRGDRVFIPTATDSRGDYQVVIEGEVKFPGTYPISRSRTTLSDLVSTAGGFNDRALLNGSLVFRKSPTAPSIAPLHELLRHARAAQFNMVDSSYFFNLMKVGLEPVHIDFNKLFHYNDTSSDVILRDGDIVIIATDQQSVLVQGQVSRPGYQPFKTGVPLSYYIERAEGFTESALDDDTRIIKRGTLDWKEPSDTEIESGDIIFVPKKIPKDLTYYLAIFRDAGTFLAAIATTALLIHQVTRNP